MYRCHQGARRGGAYEENYKAEERRKERRENVRGLI
jgi:hypothetical protein